MGIPFDIAPGKNRDDVVPRLLGACTDAIGASMTTSLPAAALVAAVLAMLSVGAAAAEDPHQEHQGERGRPALTLDDGRKWSTDAPLRHGMEEIRALIAARHATARTGKPLPGGDAEVGARIDAQIGSIVQHCKLPPRADAALHVVLGEIMAGSRALQDKEPATSPDAGAAKVESALVAYATHFDHPGWKPVE